MEASALRAPAVHRRSLASPLLRLRSDEQLVALFRAGSEDAFAVIHDRYRQRLFGYVRQMLATGPRADAEDVLQDVFVRAYGALRSDERDVNLRAWLYRVAHNRSIDQLRRPTPAASEIFDMSRTPLQDPIETAQRRDDLRRLVDDVGRLPEQQRSAILMREIDGLAYADIAVALDVTVPAVKSLLVRARTGLVEAIEARDTDCSVIRADLLDSYDRGVKASGRARRHMRECSGCREYRGTLKSLRRSFAALSPAVGFAPLAVAAKALGLGGAGGGGAAASVGGGGAALGGTMVGATACKVAVVVCAGALAAGGTAAEVHHLTKAPAKTAHTTTATHRVAASPAVVAPATARHRTDLVSVPVTPATRKARGKDTATEDVTQLAAAPVVADDPATTVATDPAATTESQTGKGAGGSSAPDDPTVSDQPTVKVPSSSTPQPVATTVATADPAASVDPGTTGGTQTPPPSSGPPPEH